MEETEQAPTDAELPSATGIPFVDENEVRTIEFVSGGHRHTVEVRPRAYGRSRSIQSGLRVRTWEEPQEDGTIRRVRELNPHELGGKMQQLFDTYVVRINGTSWSKGHRVEALDDDWVAAFVRAFQPDISDVLDTARKKSLPP